MKATAFVATLKQRLDAGWSWVRDQAPTQSLLVVSAVLICLASGFALQRQAQTHAKLSLFREITPHHMQLSDWVAEFFVCEKDQCKRVLKKQPGGTYEVASEKLPLGRGRFINSDQFTSRPTHVKLSHRLGEDEIRDMQTRWPKEKPVFALAGQPVCDNGVCRSEDLTQPMTKLTLGKSTWIQFDSHIAADGRFGPQSLPPILTAQSRATDILATKNNFQRGVIFELAITVIAPLIVLGVTFWTGLPTIFTALAQFLLARAAWSLLAADTLMGQPALLYSLGIKNSFALTTFVAGWMFATLLQFIYAVWTERTISQKRQTTLWASASVVALLATYAFPAGTPAAAIYLRALDTALLAFGGIAFGLICATYARPNWNNKISRTIRNHADINPTPRWIAQAWTLSGLFGVSAVFGLAATLSTQSVSYSFNWGTMLLPVAATCALLYARPQLTQADVQSQKDLVTQQELLVKLLSQLSTFKHRAQAISLVVNFCNRELPKLGFEPPSFCEQRPATERTEGHKDYEVVVESPIKGPHQTFGWIVAKAKQRNEKTAMGERIVEALTTGLAQHLDNLIRTSLLESEVQSGQRFIPRELMKLFAVSHPSALDPATELSCTGNIVSVNIRSGNKNRASDEANDRAIVQEVNELFAKSTAETGGYIAHQEGLRWTVIFRDNPQTALKWIESTQNTLRQWNQHRQNLGMSTQECVFGAHRSQVTLRMTENGGQTRPWLCFDLLNIANTLSEVATDYFVSTLLSDEFVECLKTTAGNTTLPDSIRPIDRVWNRSKTTTVDVFEFFGADPDLRRTAKQRSVELFSQGVRLYLTGYFDGARSIMSQILENDPNDKAAQRLMGNLSQSDDLKAA